MFIYSTKSESRVASLIFALLKQPTNFLSTHQLSKREKGNLIVRSISIQQQEKERVAIAGETGSGKTTLLRMIAGWVQPDEGTIFFQGEKVKGPEEKLIPGHEGIAYLSQYFELPQHLRVSQALEYASEVDIDRANQLYRICRIEHLLRRKTDELSGGEAQRVALAMLFSKQPRLLLLDEPFSNLDYIHKTVLKQVVQELEQEMKLTIMLVSHDPQDILSWAHHILIMKDGAIVQADNPEKVYRQPTDEYVAGLLGKYDVLDKEAMRAMGYSGDCKDEGNIIRPAQYNLVGEGEGVKGEVLSSLFLGDGYELSVRTVWGTHTVKFFNTPLKQGDAVFIRLREE